MHDSCIANIDMHFVHLFFAKGCENHWRNGESLEGSTGIIKSPNYPHAFAHGMWCNWNVVGPEGGRIKVEFDDFDLPPHRRFERNGTSYYYCSPGLAVSKSLKMKQNRDIQAKLNYLV